MRDERMRPNDKGCEDKSLKGHSVYTVVQHLDLGSNMTITKFVSTWCHLVQGFPDCSLLVICLDSQVNTFHLFQCLMANLDSLWPLSAPQIRLYNIEWMEPMVRHTSSNEKVTPWHNIGLRNWKFRVESKNNLYFPGEETDKMWGKSWKELALEQNSQRNLPKYRFLKIWYCSFSFLIALFYLLGR